MTRTEIIQALIDKYKLKSYIEIGTQKKCNNFDKIKCEYKLSVDPDLNSDADVHLTSDEFFVSLDRVVEMDLTTTGDILPNVIRNSLNKFDLIFIDGLHEEEQALRDIENSLSCLSDNGFIVVHDCNPTSELVQRVPRESKQWTGNVWKAWVRLRERDNLMMFVVDCDWGCGVIAGNKKSLSLNRIDELTYENLDKNRERWLNLVDPIFFKTWYM